MPGPNEEQFTVRDRNLYQSTQELTRSMLLSYNSFKNIRNLENYDNFFNIWPSPL